MQIIPIAVPGAPRLIDLIQTDEEISPAFYRALGETLVVKDLGLATEIAYKGDRAVHRVVTLDGNLIETSGTMTGGGSKASGNSACMRTSKKDNDGVTAEEFSDMTEKQAELERSLDTCRKDRLAIERKIEDCKIQIRKITNDIQTIELSLQRLFEQEKDIVNQLPMLHNASSASQDEIENEAKFTEMLYEIDKEIKVAAPDRDDLMLKVKEIQKTIKSNGGSQLKSIRDKIEQLGSKIDVAQKRLADNEVRCKECGKQATKAALARSKNEKDLEKVYIFDLLF